MFLDEGEFGYGGSPENRDSPEYVRFESDNRKYQQFMEEEFPSMLTDIPEVTPNEEQIDLSEGTPWLEKPAFTAGGASSAEVKRPTSSSDDPFGTSPEICSE